MFRIIITILFLMYSSPLTVLATDWYVRPYGYDYSSPIDGTSKDHAFVGLGNVKWGEGGVQSGDRLVLCRKPDDPMLFARGLNIGASGIPGEPIFIESEDAGSPETIVGPETINYPGIPGYDPNKPTSIGRNAIGGSDFGYVVVRNINIERCGGIYFSNANNVLVENVTFRNVYRGIYFVGGGEKNTIKDCKVHTSISSCLALIGSDPEHTTPLKGCVIENNECGYSLQGDGITLHQTNDEFLYDIGLGNKVLNNVCHHNKEEGLDITSGSSTLVEGNKTYANESAGAVIWHGARNVVFVRNFSYSESGLYVGPEEGDALIAYNIFDSGEQAPLRILQGRNYRVYNNFIRYQGAGIKPAAIDIRNADDIVIENNIVISLSSEGCLLRMHYGNPDTQNIRFSHNCWWHSLGSGALSFYDKDKKLYEFNEFKKYSNVSDTFFANPKVNTDYTPRASSPCIDAGFTIGDESYLAKDFHGNSAPIGVRDIGAVEVQPPPLSPTNLHLTR